MIEPLDELAEAADAGRRGAEFRRPGLTLRVEPNGRETCALRGDDIVDRVVSDMKDLAGLDARPLDREVEGIAILFARPRLDRGYGEVEISAETCAENAGVAIGDGSERSLARERIEDADHFGEGFRRASREPENLKTGRLEAVGIAAMLDRESTHPAATQSGEIDAPVVVDGAHEGRSADR